MRTKLLGWNNIGTFNFIHIFFSYALNDDILYILWNLQQLMKAIYWPAVPGRSSAGSEKKSPTHGSFMKS